jgi:hypothetical protein
VDSSVALETIFDLGSCLLTPDGTVMDCSTRYTAENRHIFYIRLCLEIDTNRQPGRALGINDVIFFGEVSTHFKCSLENDHPRLLAWVKIYKATLIKGQLFPRKVPSASIKIRILSVKRIKALCGCSEAPGGIQHAFW